MRYLNLKYTNNKNHKNMNLTKNFKIIIFNITLIKIFMNKTINKIRAKIRVKIRVKIKVIIRFKIRVICKFKIRVIVRVKIKIFKE